MIDVLFILVFASLAQAAAPEPEPERIERPEPPVAADAAPGPTALADAAPVAPADYAAAREAGLALALARLSDQPAVVLRISEAGQLTAVEVGAGQRLEVGVPLLERVPDRDVALAYLGDRSADLQLCAVARRYAAIDGRLVVLAPARPLVDLPVALVRGLRRDVERCAGGLAVIADPPQQQSPTP